MDSVQKRRIAERAVNVIESLGSGLDDGDSTEDLAAIYAAAQVLERELITRSHLNLEQVAYIQVVGKRIGATLSVAVEEEILDDPTKAH